VSRNNCLRSASSCEDRVEGIPNKNFGCFVASEELGILLDDLAQIPCILLLGGDDSRDESLCSDFMSGSSVASRSDGENHGRLCLDVWSMRRRLSTKNRMAATK
jgi:hypothetical protein